MPNDLQVYAGQEFAFAHGRIGVLQQSLLSQSDIDRMLGTRNLQEAERTLTELKLTNQINQGLSREGEILTAVGGWVRREVEHMAPEHKLPAFQILWLEGDAPLLAFLLKEKRGLTSAISREPESAITAYDPEELRLLVRDDEEGHLPEELVRFVRDTLANEELTAQHIDQAAAQFVADTQLKFAKKSGSSAIRAYVRHGIDIQNIRTALRTQNLELEERKALLLEGGTVPAKELTGDVPAIAKAIEMNELSYALADFLRKEGHKDANALERAFSEVLAEDIAVMWNVTLSIEPLFAFAALALSHLRLLRVLLIGKANGLSPQDIKKILPPFIPSTHYVL